MSACVNWIALRFAFVVGFAVFVLALFGILPGIFLLVGFGLYCIATAFWLYPRERLYPSDEDMATVSILLGTRYGRVPVAKSGKAHTSLKLPFITIVPTHLLSNLHSRRHKA